MKKSELRQLIREELLNEGSYDKDWIKQLKNVFDGATVTIDKSKEYKPLYGGGNYTYVGYKVQLSENNPFGDIEAFILEGLQINGVFINPSLIIQIDNSWKIHTALKIDIKYGESVDKNIDNVLGKAVEKLNQKGK